MFITYLTVVVRRKRLVEEPPHTLVVHRAAIICHNTVPPPVALRRDLLVLRRTIFDEARNSPHVVGRHRLVLAADPQQTPHAAQVRRDRVDGGARQRCVQDRAERWLDQVGALVVEVARV